MPEAAGGDPGALERMPKWLICIPLVLQWLWLTLKHGSATLPSASNPGITAGGLVGETKLEYFDCMGPLARAATAAHCALPPEGRDADQAQAAMVQAGLRFPLVAKPDLGMCGFGVCRLDDALDLARYLRAFPRDQTIVLQQYLPQEGEAGIFYARPPGEDGRIIGLALRHFPRVTGDGRSTIAALIAADPRADRIHNAGHALALDTGRVPAAGEVVRLATIGSTRVGGLYRNGAGCITPALTAAIDAIARDMGDFHFGRFDVRFESLPALREGRGFSIMEVNGAGSEAIEAWDPQTGLVQAFRTIFAKQRLLFEIAAANRSRGHRPIGLVALARLHFMQQRLLDAYPPSN
ncbi:MAG: hypothetical protein EOO25_00525 [Comamonadaceae bacterium]|nr:MAG: hypothetical protein EOO25_00525 [Comamonadaceae bacterium]